MTDSIVFLAVFRALLQQVQHAGYAFYREFDGSHTVPRDRSRGIGLILPWSGMRERSTQLREEMRQSSPASRCVHESIVNFGNGTLSVRFALS